MARLTDGLIPFPIDRIKLLVEERVVARLQNITLYGSARITQIIKSVWRGTDPVFLQVQHEIEGK